MSIEQFNIVEKIPLFIWFINIVVVLGAVVLSALLNIWLRRTGIGFGDKLQECKYPKDWGWDGDVLDWFLGFLLLEVLIGGWISVGISELIVSGYFGTTVIWVSLMLLVVFAPRFIIDLCRGLKFNTKTGDLDKIIDLQKQIDELKGKGE